MTRRRVVITGIGAITPIGSGVNGLWDGVLSGRSAIRRATRFDTTQFRSHHAAQVNDFNPLDYMDARMAHRLDRYAQLGIASARQASNDAGLDWETINPERCGVSIGSALGGISHAEAQHSIYLREGIGGVTPTLAIAVYGGASGANLAIEFNLRGPNLSNSSSCASGAIALGEAARVIRDEQADVMLAGGVEAPLAPLTFGAFSIIKAMSAQEDPARACKPFDRLRDGFVMAEGAAVLVLEEHKRAVARGARIYGEIRGFATTTDGYHMTAPRPDGSDAARAIHMALSNAEAAPDTIGYLNAHATGTPLGDVAEACAIRSAFGEHTDRMPVSGTKALYGHPLGASGAIEAAITVLALAHGYLPGTANLETPDPSCCLNLIEPGGIRAHPELAVSTSFGFGGINAALVLAKTNEMITASETDRR